MSIKQYSKFNRTNILLYASGVVIVVLLVGIFSRNGFMRDLFGCHRMSCLMVPESASWKLTDVYEETQGSTYRALYTHPIGIKEKNAFIRVDVRDHIDTETAVDYIHGRIAGMKALYENIRSPYPGLLSNEIVCDSEYKPTYSSFATKQGVVIEEIVGYLNDRMTFGSCQKAEAKYKGVMVMFACFEKQQLYQIEFIVPNEDFDLSGIESMVRATECR